MMMKNKKLRELQKIDSNIIKFLSEHRGIDRAIKGKIFVTCEAVLNTYTSKVVSLAQLITAILSLSMKMSAELALSRNNGQASPIITQLTAIS
jgi:hypothetical protein